MDEAVASPFFHLMPITVPTGCQLLLANTDQLRRCQLNAFDRWVRSTVPRSFGPLAQGPEAVNWASSNLPLRNSCCYRWSLLDCLAEAVQDYCTDAEAFDLRYVDDLGDERLKNLKILFHTHFFFLGR